MFLGALSPLARLVVDRKLPKHNSYPVEIPQIGKKGNPLTERRLLLQRTSKGFECSLTDQLPDFGGITQVAKTKYKFTPEKEQGNSLTDKKTTLHQTLPDGSVQTTKSGWWTEIVSLLFHRKTIASIHERTLNRSLELMATEEERAQVNRQ